MKIEAAAAASMMSIVSIKSINAKACVGIILLILLASTYAAAGQSFIDDSGRQVVWEKPFDKIVSLYGAHTENLFSLGLGEEIVGVSESDDFPEAVNGKARFHFRDDPEKFIAARPDLVLIRPMILDGYQRFVGRLEDAGITVVSLQPNTVEEMFDYWRRLGALTGRPERAEAMILEFDARLNDLSAKVADIPLEKRPRVYFEAIHGRMKTFAPSSMALFVLEAAGGINIAADAESRRGTNIAEYGQERILSRGPEIDVYLAQVGPMNKVSIEEIASESGFGAIKAVGEGKIFLVDEKIVSRPTMRLLEGVGTVMNILYPGRFRDEPRKAGAK
jgi:iron complex transport system substrate-binding protein